ncbi:GNAT family N-acetyltransferase [uncultured Roseibium sp.]|uniref:GNAT family N-acetyltransferase n=1 Tax=uncultured Roseibium sp. TaxID=1936171 RepID=UPI00259A6EBD|nr:GNAT family N-acetyltransferase [uncultured Roseibium sp.]
MSSDSGVAFRPARDGDGQALLETTCSSIMALGASHYPAEVLSGWMGTRDAAYYESEIREGTITVAECDGAVVGYVDAVPGEVVRLFVVPSFAGRGLGGALLRIALDEAQKDHAGPIKLEATLNAESFYAHHGFKRVGLGYFSLQRGGAPIQVVHMERPVRAEGS